MLGDREKQDKGKGPGGRKGGKVFLLVAGRELSITRYVFNAQWVIHYRLMMTKIGCSTEIRNQAWIGLALLWKSTVVAHFNPPKGVILR